MNVFRQLQQPKKDRAQLNLEVSEIQEISDLMFRKLDERVRALRALEASIDQKATALARLVQRAETSGTTVQPAAMTSRNGADDRLTERLAAVEKRLQAHDSVIAAADKRIAQLHQYVQKAGAVEQKIQSAQAFLTAIDTHAAAQNQIAQRTELLEQKMRGRDSMVSELDKKILALQQMLKRAEMIRMQGNGMNRQQEIVSLFEKGLASRDIAEVLDMPCGEVELVLDMNMHSV